MTIVIKSIYILSPPCGFSSWDDLMPFKLTRSCFSKRHLLKRSTSYQNHILYIPQKLSTLSSSIMWCLFCQLKNEKNQSMNILKYNLALIFNFCFFSLKIWCHLWDDINSQYDTNLYHHEKFDYHEGDIFLGCFSAKQKKPLERFNMIKYQWIIIKCFGNVVLLDHVEICHKYSC